MVDTRPIEDAGDAAWQSMVARLAAGENVPFDEQWRLFQALEAGRSVSEGPLPVWRPGPEQAEASNAAALMRELGVDDFRDLHSWSVRERAAYWRWIVGRLGVVLDREPRETLDLAGGVEHAAWLPGARLSIVESCFTSDEDAPAVLVASEDAPEVRRVSCSELERLVRRVQGGLEGIGLGPGDRAALYMPMNLECVAAYLAIVRMGAAVVSIADSFSAGQLRQRLDIGGAGLVVTSSSFRRAGKRVELYSKVREATAPRAVVVPGPGDTPGTVVLRDGDVWWDDLVSAPPAGAAHVTSPDALTNVLFSSGTTGEPKAIPWDQLTPLKCAADGHLHHDIRPGDVVAWPTNVGWMMGPWLIYASLVNRAAMALWEGSPASPGFLRFVREAGVTMLGVVPSLVRAWRDLEVADELGLPSVRTFSSTGEPFGREDSLWLMSRTDYRAPVIEYCGGTEIGGGYITGSMQRPASPGAFSTPALGLDLVVLDEAGAEVGEGETGEVFVVPPSIGLSQRLLNRDHHEVYHAGCPRGPAGEELRRHGDVMERLGGGFYRAHGRADDTMNLGGIKVSARELEVVAEGHAAVREAAAVSVAPPEGGAERLVLFVVPTGAIDADVLRGELQRRVAEELNPLFRVSRVVPVEALPRTASNKVMRRTLRKRASAVSEPGRGGSA